MHKSDHRKRVGYVYLNKPWSQPNDACEDINCNRRRKFPRGHTTHGWDVNIIKGIKTIIFNAYNDTRAAFQIVIWYLILIWTKRPSPPSLSSLWYNLNYEKFGAWVQNGITQQGDWRLDTWHWVCRGHSVRCQWRRKGGWQRTCRVICIVCMRHSPLGIPIHSSLFKGLAHGFMILTWNVSP